MTGRAAVGCLALLCGLSSAAPPAVTYFYPAGAQRGTTVEVTAGGTFERWPVQVWASDKAITATAGKDKGKVSITVAADAVPGVYWVRLHDAQGASFLRPFIVGTLPEVAEKEPNDDPGRAQSIPSSAVVNGRLEKNGDVDVFAFPLKKGETLVASVDAYQSLRSPMDAVLQVLTADGFVLAENNDWHGLDPHIAFTAPKEGTYLIRLFAFPAVPDAGIRLSGGETFVYRLTLTTGGFADYPMPLAVERKPGATVAVHGWNIPPDARTLPVTGSGDTATVFHPRLANPLAVRLESHPCWDAVGPQTYQPPFSLTGRLDSPGAVGTVSIAAKKGQPLQVRVESREYRLPVNPVIRVLDAAGKPAARAEPPKINSDVELNFTPPVDGTYKVEVRDLHGDGGPRFVYRLRVTPPEPDFDLAVNNDRFALNPGKPLDIAVMLTRRNGFAKEFELAAEGLPTGVSAVVAPPMGKADGGVVTLRLTTDKLGSSGAFRISGRTKEQPSLVRAARAALADFETTTPDLWLAVGGQVPPPTPKKKR
ncbi:MAG TPA: PPC domain-containing protein [Gemmataceae bacterium]|nr:PPC domain-containing protein [Gemmataceae bacterium]